VIRRGERCGTIQKKGEKQDIRKKGGTKNECLLMIEITESSTDRRDTLNLSRWPKIKLKFILYYNH
jgi:hypothetical protein